VKEPLFGAEVNTETSLDARGEEATMTRAYFTKVATETIVLGSSGLFLAWYVLAKIAVWPWGACGF
jgi:hypothetical protein